ncbi:MAG: hypothetical protein Q9198_000071 [Flavoplaca austrocitrina]
MAQPVQHNDNTLSEEDQRLAVQLYQSQHPQRSKFHINPCFKLRLFLFVTARLMDPRFEFKYQVIQHAVNTYRRGLASTRPGQTPALDGIVKDILEASLCQWFSVHMNIAPHHFDTPQGYQQLYQMVEALRPDFIACIRGHQASSLISLPAQTDMVPMRTGASISTIGESQSSIMLPAADFGSTSTSSFDLDGQRDRSRRWSGASIQTDPVPVYTEVVPIRPEDLINEPGESQSLILPAAETGPTSTASFDLEGQRIRNRRWPSVPVQTNLLPIQTDVIPMRTGSSVNNNEEVRSLTLPGDPDMASASNFDVEGQPLQSLAWPTAFKSFVFMTVRYGMQTFTFLSAGLGLVAGGVGQCFAGMWLSPLSIIGWLVFGVGALAWKNRVAIAVGFFQMSFHLVDRSILAPICQGNQDSLLDICYPMCTLATYLEYPLIACTDEDFRQTTSETPPLLIPRQIRFSNIAVFDVATRFQNLEISFDNSTCDILECTAGSYEGFSSGVEQYSREVGLLFHLFTITERHTNRTLQVGALQSTQPLFRLLLNLLPTNTGEKVKESALNALVNTIQPQLDTVLAAGSTVRHEISIVQANEARGSNQLQNVQGTAQLLHWQATRDRSFLEFIRRAKTSRIRETEAIQKSIAILIIGYEKATDASGSAARSFEESFTRLQTLNGVLQQHKTWQGAPRDKPSKVYLSLIHSAMVHAFESLHDWDQEDRRHEGNLFASPADRVSKMYQTYADEEIR